MTNGQSPASNTSFSTRLQSAREALSLDRKDVAAQLRLNEKIILMMEKDKYPADLPVTFIRGYIRSYSKLLQIPENEVRAALENIRPKAPTPPSLLNTPMSMNESVNSSNYFMQFFTYLILITLAALVGMWWYNHTPISSTAVVENQTAVLNEPQTLPTQIAISEPAILQENTVDTSKKINDYKKPKKVAVAALKKPSIEKPEEDASDQHEADSENIETQSDDAD